PLSHRLSILPSEARNLYSKNETQPVIVKLGIIWQIIGQLYISNSYKNTIFNFLTKVIHLVSTTKPSANSHQPIAINFFQNFPHNTYLYIQPKLKNYETTHH
ncbi:MAG: hypothetical protein WAS28_14200, partial [Saprospiraceae bacterium]